MAIQISTSEVGSAFLLTLMDPLIHSDRVLTDMIVKHLCMMFTRCIS